MPKQKALTHKINELINLKSTNQKGIHFVFANYSWPCVLPWSLVGIHSDNTLEKTDFSHCLKVLIANKFFD